MKVVITTLNSKFSHSSLAIRYLEKYCAKFQPDSVEFTINDNINTVYSRLLLKRADVYCFSCYIWNITLICQIASMLKTTLPECVVVFGGPQAEEHHFVDYLILGEGEEGLFYLLSNLEKGERPQKIIKKEVDISKVAPPYAKADIAKLKNKILYFETSRGCPFNCTYCLSSVDKTIKYFPPDYVYNGLFELFDSGVPIVKLVDRTFNCNAERAAEIMRFIIKNSKNTCVHLEIAPHLLNDEQMELISSAPHLFKLEMGIQSTNPQTLKAVNRLFDLEKAAQNIKRLAKCGVKIHLDLIAGLPYENYASFGRSFDFVFSLQPDMLQLGFLKVLKGTEMEKTEGIYYANHPPFEVLKTNWLDPFEICRLKNVENAVDRYYNSGLFARTIKALTSNASAFAMFEKLGRTLAATEENGKVSRKGLYNLLFEFGGNDISYLLALDFLQNNRDIPLPPFIKKTPSSDYKARLRQFTKTHGISLRNARIEPIFNKVVLADFAKGEVKEITDSF
ncbi:MAG: B12-binding domain-containing radical SAM protein [Firmicutes bacterium]|nr:B12-binding domain-containing radical SAM protein [Bacillota bacterium]